MIPALFALLLIADNSPPSEATQPAEAAQTVKEKKICKADPSYTGSRMRKKLCLTEAEWDAKTRGKSAADLKTIGGR